MSETIKKGNTILKDALILFVISLVLSAILGFTNEITKDKIAEQAVTSKQTAYKAVFPDLGSGTIGDTDTALLAKAAEIIAACPDANVAASSKINDVREAKDASGKVIGYAVDVTNTKGYGGDIVMAVGITTAGKITGVQIISNSETAGLGANCTKESWRGQFTGKSYPITYSKTGATGANEIDAISSATFTTKAVTWGVNAALYFVQQAAGTK